MQKSRNHLIMICGSYILKKSKTYFVSKEEYFGEILVKVLNIYLKTGVCKEYVNLTLFYADTQLRGRSHH